MSSSSEWQLVVITGASKGFGLAVAESLARQSLAPTHFRLAGRDAAGLATAKAAILGGGRSEDSTVVEEVVSDLSDMGGLKGAAELLFSVPAGRSYFKVIFVNNHGSLGPLANIGSFEGDNLSEMALAFNVNVSSCCYLTTDLMQRCQPGKSYPSAGIRKVSVVNVSSLAAIQPFGSWGIYCAGKAAREMFHRCLSEELAKRDAAELPQVRVLNYAPGPLDTNMQREIREGAAVDKETQTFYRQLKEEGKLVSPAESASKLVRIIMFEKYKCGEHLDYYDATSADTIEGLTTCCSCESCTCGVDCACKSSKTPQCSSCANR